MITFAELKNKSLKLFPALFLEKYSTYKGRKKTRTFLLWLLSILFVLMIIAPTIPLEYGSISTFFIDYATNIRSAFFFFFTVWLIMYLVEAFYFSFYFRQSDVDFEVAKLATNSDSSDITKSFLESQIGEYAMMRLGIGNHQIDNFLDHRQKRIRETSFDIEQVKNKSHVSIFDYGKALYQNDKEFSFFLSQYGISENDFIGALEWADDVEWKIREFEKWWDKSNLVRRKSLGRKWSFNKIDSIDKYGHSIFVDKNYIDLADHWRVFKKDAHKIESALVKNINSNVLVVSPTIDLGMQVIGSLAKMILLGRVLFELEGRRIFVLDPKNIIEKAKDENDLKILFKDILDGVSDSDKTIIVIPNLGDLIEKFDEIDVDFSNNLTELLNSRKIQVVSISTNNDYSQIIEPNRSLMVYFEKCSLSETDDRSIIRILQNIVYSFEKDHDVFFTYQSIKSIADKTKIYFDDVVYPEKVTAMIEKIIEQAKIQDKKIIRPEDTNSIVTVKHEV